MQKILLVELTLIDSSELNSNSDLYESIPNDFRPLVDPTLISIDPLNYYTAQLLSGWVCLPKPTEYEMCRSISETKSNPSNKLNKRK